MMRVRRRQAMAGLAAGCLWLTLPWVRAVPPMRGPANDMDALAAASPTAVWAPRARDLGIHAPVLLNWVGLSFPEVAPRYAGTLRGLNGYINLLDANALAAAGLVANQPLAALHLVGAPAPVVVAPAPENGGCTGMAAALSGGPPQRAGAWQKRGLCLVVVGECGIHRCGKIATPRPGTRAPRLPWPEQSVRAHIGGAEFRKLMPAAVRGLLGNVKDTFWSLDTAASDGGGTTMVIRGWLIGKASWMLARLGSAVRPQDGAAQTGLIADAVARPTAAGVALWKKRGGVVAAAVEQAWGAPLDKVWRKAGCQRMHVRWQGINGHVEVETQQDLLRVFPGSATFECRGAQSLAAQAGKRLQEQGLVAATGAAPGSAWVNQDGATAFTLHMEGAPSDGSVAAVDIPAGTRMLLRTDGRWLVAALRRIPLLHAAATPVFRALAGAEVLLGPSLERMGAASMMVMDGPNNVTLALELRVALQGSAGR